MSKFNSKSETDLCQELMARTTPPEGVAIDKGVKSDDVRFCSVGYGGTPGVK